MIKYATQALKEAKEVLKLDPFPEDLISNLTNMTSPIETRREWLEIVIQKLEARIKILEEQLKTDTQST